MTMRATITNTSNWAGEDILVTSYAGEKVLKPGEMTDIGLGHGAPDRTVHIKDVSQDETKPFMLNDTQVFPQVISVIGPIRR